MMMMMMMLIMTTTMTFGLVIPKRRDSINMLAGPSEINDVMIRTMMAMMMMIVLLFILKGMQSICWLVHQGGK